MTSQPPPDPYGQPYQPDPYGQGTPPPPASAPQYPQHPPPPGQYPPPGSQYPGGQPGGYPPPPPGGPGGTSNTLAIVSLVLSLVGVVTYLSAPVGAILGHVARKQIRERGEQGEGLAMAGIIVGWLVTGLYTLFCCGLIVLAVTADNT